MNHKYTMPLKSLVEQNQLEILYRSGDYEQVAVSTTAISRPGLLLAGYSECFESDRLQLIGRAEGTYLGAMDIEKKRMCYEELFSKKIPALIYCHKMLPSAVCLEVAQEYDVTVLQTEQDTSEIMASIIAQLRVELAPRITRHGVLVEVYGEGLLILGESGVGKSETAIELVKRGHRLIADDAVEIKRVSEKTLIGAAPELIRYYMELRGIGVIDVRRIFGMGSVKPTERIDLIINLENWDENKPYDRLGAESRTTTIMGVKVPVITVPVKPGRNLAMIMEVAAMNNRQKRMGYNAAEAFTQQVNRHFDESQKMD